MKNYIRPAVLTLIAVLPEGDAITVSPSVVAYRIPGATSARSWQVEKNGNRICREDTAPGDFGAHLFTREEVKAMKA